MTETTPTTVTAAPAQLAANSNQAQSVVNFNRIQLAVSTPRLSPYLVLAKGDIDKAILLHQWNAELGATLMPILHFAEVLVRNLALQRVVNNFGKNWYDNPNFYNLLKIDLKRRLLDQVTKERAAGRHGNITNYTANEMTFGFWSSLYANKFHSRLWNVPLSRIRTSIDRNLTVSQLQGKIDKVKTFRNNVAHHKNLITKPTDSNYNLALDVIGDICGSTRAQVEKESQFPAAWQSPPVPRIDWGS